MRVFHASCRSVPPIRSFVRSFARLTEERRNVCRERQPIFPGFSRRNWSPEIVVSSAVTYGSFYDYNHWLSGFHPEPNWDSADVAEASAGLTGDVIKPVDIRAILHGTFIRFLPLCDIIHRRRERILRQRPQRIELHVTVRLLHTRLKSERPRSRKRNCETRDFIFSPATKISRCKWNDIAMSPRIVIENRRGLIGRRAAVQVNETRRMTIEREKSYSLFAGLIFPDAYICVV